MEFNIKFTPSTLDLIQDLQRYPEILEPNLEEAMHDSVENILYGIVVDREIPRFKNPTGAFADSLHTSVDSPYQAQLWTEAPSGQRLEHGFSGMTDSLGRYYPEWPSGDNSDGYHWAERTVRYGQSFVRDRFIYAIGLSMAELQGKI